MPAGSSSSSAGGGKSSKQERIDTDIFGHVVSLGSVCLTARSLEIHGLRAYKAPFDWAYSSARMVRHCIQDDFKSYLDQGKYVVQKGHRGTGHKLYSQMQLGNIGTVWPHHTLTGKNSEDHASFARAVIRFKTVLREDRQRKLFVYCQNVRAEKVLEQVREKGPTKLTGDGEVKVPTENGPELGSIEEVRHLFGDLRKQAVGAFDLDVLYVICPPLSKATAKPVVRTVHFEKAGCGALRVHELHCLGSNTGLFFKDEQDGKALASVLIKGRKFKCMNPDIAKAVGLTDELHARVRERQASQARKEAKDEARRKLGAKARKMLKRSGRSGRSGVRKPLPSSDEQMKRKIQFEQENPKISGSGACARYQKYKKAKTVGEFYKMGGCSGDLTHDTHKGFLKFL